MREGCDGATKHGWTVQPHTAPRFGRNKDRVSKHTMGRDSSVGIVTRYGLDGLGMESRWGRDFLKPSRPALGPTQPPIQRVPGLYPGGKAAGAWS
jgi:hypothetical protein